MSSWRTHCLKVRGAEPQTMCPPPTHYHKEKCWPENTEGWNSLGILYLAWKKREDTRKAWGHENTRHTRPTLKWQCQPTTVLRFQLEKRAARRPGPDEIDDANLRARSWASKCMEAAGPWDRAGKTCSRRRQRKTESHHPGTGHLSSTKTSGTGVNNPEPAQCPGAALLRDGFIAAITPVNEDVPNSCSSPEFQQANELLKGKDIPLNSALGQADPGFQKCAGVVLIQSYQWLRMLSVIYKHILRQCLTTEGKGAPPQILRNSSHQFNPS